MDLGVVAPGRLDGRREHQRHRVARLHLGLHQEMQHPVELLDEDPEYADLRLVDDRLEPVGGSRTAQREALHGEEAAAVVHQVSDVVLEVPAAQSGERNAIDREIVRSRPFGQPRVESRPSVSERPPSAWRNRQAGWEDRGPPVASGLSHPTHPRWLGFVGAATLDGAARIPRQRYWSVARDVGFPGVHERDPSSPEEISRARTTLRHGRGTWRN